MKLVMGKELRLRLLLCHAACEELLQLWLVLSGGFLGSLFSHRNGEISAETAALRTMNEYKKALYLDALTSVWMTLLELECFFICQEVVSCLQILYCLLSQPVKSSLKANRICR